MSLFEVEGWSLSTPKSDTTAKAKATLSKKESIRIKQNKKLGRNAGLDEAIAKLTDTVSSQDLQKVFEQQFGRQGERIEDEAKVVARAAALKQVAADKKSDKIKRKRETAQVKEKNEAMEKAVAKVRTEKAETRQKADEADEQHKHKVQKTGKAGDVKAKDEKKPKPAEVAEVKSGSDAVAKAKPVQKLTPLQQKMKDKLTGSRFRWINEKLYTVSSDEAKKLIRDQPQLYNEYHEGFRNQIQSWPENPVDIYIDRVKELSKTRAPPPKGLPRDKDGTTYIADMGCGDAVLSLKVSSEYSDRKNKSKIVVHSFDLAKTNERVTVADVKHVPLPDASVHIVVFCLSLMGTNFLDFIKEAHRIMKPRGQLWISEIKSRFSDAEGEDFINAIKTHGFVHSETDNSNLMFIRFDFYKPLSERSEARAIADGQNRQNRPNQKKPKFIEKDDEEDQTPAAPLLKPCLYKKR